MASCVALLIAQAIKVASHKFTHHGVELLRSASAGLLNHTKAAAAKEDVELGLAQLARKHQLFAILDVTRVFDS